VTTAKDDLPLDQKVARWVQVSGRSIEMEAAQAVRDAGGTALQSVPYLDPVEGKVREMDVLAEFDGHDGARVPVTLVVECKRVLGGHWVTFPNETRQISADFPILLHAYVDKEDPGVAILHRAWRGGPTIFGPTPAMGSGLHEADLGPERKEDGGRDRATNALRQVWTAAQAGLVDQEWTDFWGGETTFTRIVIPVIVTSAHLWECRLGEGGEPVAAEVDYMRVLTPTPGSAVLVHVLKIGRFREFAGQLAALQAREDPRSPAEEP
jgi:hypothetical protein